MDFEGTTDLRSFVISSILYILERQFKDPGDLTLYSGPLEIFPIALREVLFFSAECLLLQFEIGLIPGLFSSG